jgi:hypothetical protein
MQVLGDRPDSEVALPPRDSDPQETVHGARVIFTVVNPYRKYYLGPNITPGDGIARPGRAVLHAEQHKHAYLRGHRELHHVRAVMRATIPENSRVKHHAMHQK